MSMSEWMFPKLFMKLMMEVFLNPWAFSEATTFSM